MIFNEKEHTYTDSGKRFRTVTDLVGKYKQPFKKNAISKAIAKRDGRTQEDVLEEWSMKGRASIDYGNSIHKAVELFIKHGQVHKLQHLSKMVKIFSEKYDRKKLNSEIIVHWTDYLLAGTIDVIERIGKNKINIIDLKTNYDLYKKSYSNFKPPLDNLKQNDINTYRLQLSFYKLLAEKYKLKVNKIKLEHWTGVNFKTIELEPINVKQLL